MIPRDTADDEVLFAIQNCRLPIDFMAKETGTLCSDKEPGQSKKPEFCGHNNADTQRDIREGTLSNPDFKGNFQVAPPL